MPYKLRKAPKRELYWVVTIETGKKHSKDPIPKDKAKAQKRILEQALRGNGIVMSGLEAMGLVEPPLTQAQIAQLQTAVANELFNFIRAGNELTVENMKAILYLCINEAGINNDISVEEEDLIMYEALRRAQEQVRVIQQQQAEEFHRQNQEQIRLQAQEHQGVKVQIKAQKSQQKSQKKAQQKAQKQQFKKGRGLRGGTFWDSHAYPYIKAIVGTPEYKSVASSFRTPEEYNAFWTPKLEGFMQESAPFLPTKSADYEYILAKMKDFVKKSMDALLKSRSTLEDSQGPIALRFKRDALRREHPSMSEESEDVMNPKYKQRAYYEEGYRREAKKPTSEESSPTVLTGNEQTLEQTLQRFMQMNSIDGSYYDELMAHGYTAAMTPAEVKARDAKQKKGKGKGKRKLKGGITSLQFQTINDKYTNQQLSNDELAEQWNEVFSLLTESQKQHVNKVWGRENMVQILTAEINEIIAESHNPNFGIYGSENNVTATLSNIRNIIRAIYRIILKLLEDTDFTSERVAFKPQQARGKGKRKLKGSGYWEDEFNRRANLIPGVNQTLLAEIGTDLKNRLAKAPITKFTRGLFSLLGEKTTKEKLVDEAIETLTRLSAEGYDASGNEWVRNPLNPRQTKKPTFEQLVTESKTTGPLGKPVIREKAPKYTPITELDPTGIYNDYTKEEPETLKSDIIRNKGYPKGFKEINLDTYKIGQPIPWGKFNSVFITAYKSPSRGHIGVLTRNLTNPISYSWYDSHGTSWRERKSHFNYSDWAEKLDSIVGDSPVDMNPCQHQHQTSLCQSFSKVRATFPELSNTEYDDLLRRNATEMANTPRFPIKRAAVPLFEGQEAPRIPQPVGVAFPTDMREAIRLAADPENQRPLRAGEYAHYPENLYATPFVAQAVQNPLFLNPQEPVPLFKAPTGRGMKGGSKKSGYVQRLIAEKKLIPEKVKNPSKYILAMKPKSKIENKIQKSVIEQCHRNLQVVEDLRQNSKNYTSNQESYYRMVIGMKECADKFKTYKFPYKSLKDLPSVMRRGFAAWYKKNTKLPILW